MPAQRPTSPGIAHARPGGDPGQEPRPGGPVRRLVRQKPAVACARSAQPGWRARRASAPAGCHRGRAAARHRAGARRTKPQRGACQGWGCRQISSVPPHPPARHLRSLPSSQMCDRRPTRARSPKRTRANRTATARLATFGLTPFRRPPPLSSASSARSAPRLASTNTVRSRHREKIPLQPIQVAAFALDVDERSVSSGKTAQRRTPVHRTSARDRDAVRGDACFGPAAKQPSGFRPALPLA